MADRVRKQGEGDDKDAAGRERLHRVMAHAGVGSRRACEDMIAQGRVSVNGEIVTDHPVWVDPDNDRIEVEGRVLQKPERKIYIMLFKPRKTVSTMSDPGGRRTVADLVDHPSARRLYPVGRLDFDTMGLLLMTNDGEMANRLTHPRYGVHKTYRAVVKGELDEEGVAGLERGIYLAERKEGRTVGAVRTQPASIRLVHRERDRTIIDIALHEGRNRQVRRMLAEVGCPVKKLVRIGMGPLKLKGLRLGEWRELSQAELMLLRRASRGGGAAAAKAAGRSAPKEGAARPPARPGRKPGARRRGRPSA